MVLSKSSHSPKQIVRIGAYRFEDRTRKPKPAASAAVIESRALLPASQFLASPTRTPGHVLLVEDHADMRALVSFLLDQAGHHVTSVESHAGALQKAKGNDLISACSIVLVRMAQELTCVASFDTYIRGFQS